MLEEKSRLVAYYNISKACMKRRVGLALCALGLICVILITNNENRFYILMV